MTAGCAHSTRRPRKPSPRQLRAYLRRFGYTAVEDPAAALASFDATAAPDANAPALQHFQQHYGLVPSGRLDGETLRLLSTPRCGSPDESFSLEPSRMSLLATGVGWSGSTLRYTFLNQHNGLDSDATSAEVAQAVTLWAGVIGRAIVFTQDPEAHILLGWFNANHGDGVPFSATDHWGHAFPPGAGPRQGEVHFNREVAWALDPAPGTGAGAGDLLSIVLHEIGHALGFTHSSNSADVMYAYFAPGERRRQLTQNDRVQAQQLYA